MMKKTSSWKRFKDLMQVDILKKEKSDEDKINAVNQALGDPIETPYEAYWFLHDHPEFISFERAPIEEKEKQNTKKPKHARIIQDLGGNWWMEYLKSHTRAIAENLNIYYVKVDKTGHVNKDLSKNTFSECWLEFGQIEWGYDWDGQWKEEKKRCYKRYFHDIELDCGAPTFDEALVILANNVLKKYGPIPANPENYVKKG